jgi:hypothetical protein
MRLRDLEKVVSVWCYTPPNQLMIAWLASVASPASGVFVSPCCAALAFRALLSESPTPHIVHNPGNSLLVDNPSNNAVRMKHGGLLSHLDTDMGIERPRSNERSAMGKVCTSLSASGPDDLSGQADQKWRKGKSEKSRKYPATPFSPKSLARSHRR